jgi:L-amino acid N-acyltransferase YncA
MPRYERIITRIATIPNAKERAVAQKLLGWMVCAKRPLKWHEIQGAISTDTVHQTIHFDERRLRIHVRDLCGSLIDVLPGDRVELVHWTAKR